MGLAICDHCSVETTDAKADGWAVATIEVVRWAPNEEDKGDLRQDVDRLMELLCPACTERALAMMRGEQHDKQGTSDSQEAADKVR